jgi:phosphoribosylamine--glycine ligase
MLTPDGPKLIEYNIRFGDPDSQVVLLRLTSDVADLLRQAASGAIVDEPTASDRAAVLVVAAAEGYPGPPVFGDTIDGLTQARAVDDVEVLCAGVAAGTDRQLHTAGGRVLDVVGLGPDLVTARARAYESLGHLSWPGMHHRTDIAREVTTP